MSRNIGVILIVIFSISSQLFSQNKRNPKKTANKGGRYFDTTLTIQINKSIPSIYIRYQEYFEPYDKDFNDFGTTYFRVEIKKSYIGKPAQVIESESEADYGPLNYDYGVDEPGIKGMFADINFDGYMDLRFKILSGANAYVVNQFYEYYLYNPKTNLFKIYEGLSEITNPTPYPDERRVYSYHRMAFSGTYGIVEVYKWKGEKLRILESYVYKVVEDECTATYWQDSCCCNYSRVADFYKGNLIVKSDSTIVESKDIPKRHLLYW